MPDTSAASHSSATTLYRSQAVQSLDRPEEFHIPLRVLGRAEWLAGLLCLALCAATLAWSCFAQIRETVRGQGVLVRSGGVFIGINAPKAGWIDALAAVGQRVEAQERVASLTTPEEDARIQDLERRLSQINDQRDAISQRYEGRLAVEAQAQQRRREQLVESAGLTQRRIAEATTMLANRQSLFSHGSSTIERVQETRERLFTAQETLSRTEAELAALDSNILTVRGQRDQELAAANRQLFDLQGQLEQARLAKNLADDIRAPQAGVVAQIPVTMNALVAPGQRMVTLETGSDRLEALLYVPGDTGKRIAPGMQVQLSPGTAPREEYGALLGTVVTVSPHPESQAEITERLANPELAKQFAQNGVPLEIRIRLQQEPGDRYVWSSKRGREVGLSSGQLLTGNVTVRRVPPITLVIPALRRWTGL
jgi:NHLM bacteriocin system secretion protein